MMKNQPIEVVNPYEWLPPYGENSIVYSCSNKFLKLEIWFDAENEEIKREFLFQNVVWFSASTFPGGGVDPISYPEYKNIGSLVEFPESELATYWDNYFHNGIKFHHFQIYFLSANKRIQVICEEFDPPSTGK